MQIVQDFYELLARRDQAGLAKILDPGIEVVYHATEGVFPWAGRFRGVDGFNAFLGYVGEALEIVSATRSEPFGDEGKVVVQTTGSWKVKANQAVVNGSMLNIFTITDSKISGYEVYADTDAFAQAMSQS